MGNKKDFPTKKKMGWLVFKAKKGKNIGLTTTLTDYTVTYIRVVPSRSQIVVGKAGDNPYRLHSHPHRGHA